jgi:ABC-type uncharacterized transport system involved in gliding motility auxiliary subunit
MKWIAKLGRRTLTAGCIVMAAVILLSVNYIAANILRHVKADLTEDDLFTISDGTRQVVQGLEEPIDIRLYYTKQLGEQAPRYAKYFDRVRGLLEQYRDISGGKLNITYLEPEPFSDTEDRAVAAGLRGVRLNLEGDTGYFGLVGTNSTDNKSVIKFLAPDREKFLEYDLTKLVLELEDPKKPPVGLMTSISISRGITPQGQSTPAWQVVNQIRESFDVYPLDQNLTKIPGEVELLMIVQPDMLTKEAAYAIDQFALRGGRILAFVDPLAELGAATPHMPGPKRKSDEFVKLLASWGVEYDPDKVATDIAHARRVQFAATPGSQPTVTDHIGWLALDARNLDQEDVLSSGIERLNVGTAGFLKKKEGASIRLSSILQTSAQSMVVDASDFGFGADPVKLLRNFRPGGKPLTLAARVTGKVSTAFPDGPPEPVKAEDKKDGKQDTSMDEGAPAGQGDKEAGEAAQVKEGDINAIIVADTDLLNDRFWVEAGDFLGQQILIPHAHNATFVLNALDNLSGSSALISLRGRGVDDRPFELVENLRKEAERRYRRKEQALVARLKSVQKKLDAVTSKGGEGNAILSEKDRKAIESFRHDMVTVRRELREVKRALREDIDLLEGTLKFANIGGVPLLIAFGGIAALIARRRRNRK